MYEAADVKKTRCEFLDAQQVVRGFVSWNACCLINRSLGSAVFFGHVLKETNVLLAAKTDAELIHCINVCQRQNL